MFIETGNSQAARDCQLAAKRLDVLERERREVEYLKEPKEKAPDYGEPWGHKTDPETGDNILVDRNGNEIGCIYESSVWHRIKAESQALAGCPDPEAFVVFVKQFFSKREKDGYPILSWIREESK